MTPKKKIIVLGFMASCPVAGVIWQHLHYIIGLQRLGHEVYYVEDTEECPYDPLNCIVTEDCSYAAKMLGKLSQEFGFDGRWSYCARFKEPFEVAGMPRQAVLELYRTCDCALNICGSHAIHEDLATIRNLVYVESDPGVEQIRIDQGDRSAMDQLRAHRHLFTFGENVGTSRFVVPTHGFRWLATRQPIVTDLWSNEGEPLPHTHGALFTSVCNWSTSGIKDIGWRGSIYRWSKAAEFRRFVEAPLRSGEIFMLATDIPDREERDVFIRNNWRLLLPYELSADWRGYRDFIRSSKGEFTCAKDQYVRLNTGWFSDRSACYLAAGRPVITQATGFEAPYKEGKGLFSFSTMEGVVEATAEIRADYALHSRAALTFARETFEAETVLGSLLKRAGA